MNRIFKKTAVLVVGVFFIATGVVQAANRGDALEAMERGVNGLLRILKEQQPNGDEAKKTRHEAILNYIHSQFDFDKMSQLVVGATRWKQQSSDERARFSSLFAQLLEHAYVGKLENYRDEKVSFVKERMQGRRAIVYTIIEHNNRKIPINYTAYENAGKWLVYDVNIEGVSLVRNYRSQFLPLVRKDGFHGLLKVLQEKITALDAEKKGP